MNDNELSDLIGLGEIGSTLIEKVASVCGWYYSHSPKVLARNAFVSEVENSNLSVEEKCALISNVNVIIKEYSNQKSILKIALEHLNEDAQPNKVDDLWLEHYFDKIRLVSTEQTQIIWGKLLAEECNNPNSVPKSLLFILEQMDKEDALLFTEVCSCTVHFKSPDDEAFCPIIHDFNGGNFWHTKLDLESIIRLENLGLIKQDIGFLKPGFANSFSCGPVVASYANETYDFPENYLNIPVDRVIYTKSGLALYKTISAPFFVDFFNSQCVDFWKERIEKSR